MTLLTLHLSNVRLEVDGLPASALAGLRSLWAACEVPRHVVHTDVRWRIEGFALLDGEDVLSTGRDEAELPSMVEYALYTRLVGWHPGATLMHAATVARAGRAIIVLGDSGMGKSSVALAAVQRGFEYVTDELTLTDGTSVWGIPRAIQFDPVPEDQPLPGRLASLDQRGYSVRFADGVVRSQPILPCHETPVAGAFPANRAAVVELLGEGEPCLTPLAPVHTLAALHRSLRSPPRSYLDVLVGRRRARQLRWDDPALAVDRLSDWLETLDE